MVNCYSHQRIRTRTKGLGDKTTSREHPKYSIISIGQNTEKSLGNLRKLIVTQTLVLDHLLTPMWRTLKTVIIIIIRRRTSYIKAIIDKRQQNSKCRRCGDRDETINHMISECRKLALKEYKTRHDWVGKVNHWEMWKKFKFDHTNKWYMHNPVPVHENDTHKLLWDFDIHTDQLIPARRPDLIIINKKKKKKKKERKKKKRICKIVDFAIPADHRIKLKECEKKDKYLDFVEHAGDNYTNCYWCVWNSN